MMEEYFKNPFSSYKVFHMKAEEASFIQRGDHIDVNKVDMDETDILCDWDYFASDGYNIGILDIDTATAILAYINKSTSVTILSSFFSEHA